MSDRPIRCPFCGNTDLAPAGSVNWLCVGSLGCGGSWDPAVIVAAVPSVETSQEPEPEPRPVRLRAKRVVRRAPGRRPRLYDAA